MKIVKLRSFSDSQTLSARAKDFNYKFKIFLYS